jgi:hypothetical protein
LPYIFEYQAFSIFLSNKNSKNSEIAIEQISILSLGTIIRAKIEDTAPMIKG